VTAIVAAGHALGARSLTGDERGELSEAVVEEGERLSALIDKLLDLSRLQAGRAEPQRDWISIEEVLLAARDGLADGTGVVRLVVNTDLPPIRADAAQLERAFGNLLEKSTGVYVVGNSAKLMVALIIVITLLTLKPSGLFGRVTVKRV